MKRIHLLMTLVTQQRLNIIFVICMLLVVIFVGPSLVNSGYNYTFDNDELHHTQVTYLIQQGYVPFRDIYLTVYPPFFHWFLRPVYQFFGFNFEAMYMARILMIGLFALRIILVAGIVSLILSKRVAVIAVCFYLLSPFAAFAEMQIRPDNLMITVFLVGLFLTLIAWKKNSHYFDFLSSFFMMFSLLLLMKILPAVGVYYAISVGFLAYKKYGTRLAAVLFGAFFALFVFSVPFLFQGTFSEMVQQVFVESLSSYSGVFEYPVPLGFFYHPRNIGVFGLPDKPFNWIFVWFLLLSAGAGVYVLFERVIKPIQKQSWKTPILLLLIGSFAGQFAFLFLAESVFIQHYITLNWLFALLSAVFVYQLLTLTRDKKLLHSLFTFVLFFSIALLSFTSIQANNNRATINATELKTAFTGIWQLIPPDAPVFPNVLFRRLAYPVPFGHFIGNIPPAILERLPSITQQLESQQTPYVYLDQYYFDRLPQAVQSYITTHYTQSTLHPNFYTRTVKP